MMLQKGDKIRNRFDNKAEIDAWVSTLERRAFARIIAASKDKFQPDLEFMQSNAAHINSLQQNGVLFLPGYFNFSETELTDLQKLMQQQGKEWDLVRTCYPDPIPKALQAFYNDPWLDNLINHSRGYSSLTKVMRLYASAHLAEISGSFLWHHDGLFDYYKIIVYLSEVTMQNGPFAYCLGSQKTRWKYYSYERSRFEEADLKEYDIQYFCGKAGDLLILNANGIHKASNPEPGQHRLVASTAYIDFESDQSTDHLYAAKLLKM